MILSAAYAPTPILSEPGKEYAGGNSLHGHIGEGAREGAPFIQSHIIEATHKTFDDFAGSEIDENHLKMILNL